MIAHPEGHGGVKRGFPPEVSGINSCRKWHRCKVREEDVACVHGYTGT